MFENTVAMVAEANTTTVEFIRTKDLLLSMLYRVLHTSKHPLYILYLHTLRTLTTQSV